MGLSMLNHILEGILTGSLMSLIDMSIHQGILVIGKINEKNP